MNDKRAIVCFGDLKKLGVPYGRTHLKRMMKARIFPKSFKLSGRPKSRNFWYLDEVLEWINSRHTFVMAHSFKELGL